MDPSVDAAHRFVVAALAEDVDTVWTLMTEDLRQRVVTALGLDDHLSPAALELIFRAWVMGVAWTVRSRVAAGWGWINSARPIAIDVEEAVLCRPVNRELEPGESVAVAALPFYMRLTSEGWRIDGLTYLPQETAP